MLLTKNILFITAQHNFLFKSRYKFNQDNGKLPILIENRGPTQPGMVSFLQKNVSESLKEPKNVQRNV